MSIFVAKHIKSTYFFIIYILDMLFLSIFPIYKKAYRSYVNAAKTVLAACICPGGYFIYNISKA